MRTALVVVWLVGAGSGIGFGFAATGLVSPVCESPLSVTALGLQIEVSDSLASPSGTQAKKQRFLYSPIRCKDPGAAQEREMLSILKTDFSQETYACFKHVVAEWAWQEPAQFEKHWQAWWAKPAWNIYEHAWFLMTVLTDLWLSRPRLQRSAEQARKNIYLKRFCEAINHAAQNQKIARDVRLAFSTESLMRYVDDLLSEHHYKENFKVFLRCSTYSKDYILPL